jgi:oxygen-independent coproporphyrinogen-3 oxidase
MDALINGILIHGLDFDDTHLASIIHPTCTSLPCARALGGAVGRGVTQEEIEAALAAVSGTGWREWNLDLVFGIPGQDWATAAADLDAAVAAGPTHISLYDLTYTPAFEASLVARLGAGARGAAGAFAEEHYAAATARLEAAGYRRYEVSNFALPGHECRHNQAYWRGEDYVGIGTSAVSTVSLGDAPGRGCAVRGGAGAVPAVLPRAATQTAHGVGAERRTNPRSVAGYLAGEPPTVELLSPVTRLWERAMLGLRTSEGVDEAAVYPVIDLQARDRLLDQGCIERLHGKMRLNPGYLDMSNAVIGMLLVDPSALADLEE